MGPPVNTDGDGDLAGGRKVEHVASMGPPVNTDGDMVYAMVTGRYPWGLQWGRR